MKDPILRTPTIHHIHAVLRAHVMVPTVGVAQVEAYWASFCIQTAQAVGTGEVAGAAVEIGTAEAIAKAGTSIGIITTTIMMRVAAGAEAGTIMSVIEA